MAQGESMAEAPILEIALAARPESVTVIRQALSGLADVDGWDLAFLTDVKIAVSEACTNVVVHAYGERPDGLMHVEAHLSERLLRVVVRDDGGGISPRIQSPGAGLGLGLPLIAALTDEVHVKTAEGGPTEVDMRFAIPDGANAVAP